MKRLITFLIAIFISIALSAQLSNAIRYPLTLGMGAPGTVTGGVLNFRGLTSGSLQLRVPAAAGTGTVFQFPANNGTSGFVLRTDGNGVLTWVAQAGGIAASDTATMLLHYAKLLSPTFIGTVGLPSTTSIGSKIARTVLAMLT